MRKDETRNYSFRAVASVAMGGQFLAGNKIRALPVKRMAV
jgi:hypothetical protein